MLDNINAMRWRIKKVAKIIEREFMAENGSTDCI